MKNSQTIAVVIGRFQLPSLNLHPGYIELLNHVAANTDKVVVLLGSKSAIDEKDPLIFAHRAAMFQEEYPDFTVMELKDVNDDEQWVKNVDKLIGLTTETSDTVTLYGSRDSFLNCYKRYKGGYETAYFDAVPEKSASLIRQEIKGAFVSSKDARHALIQAQMVRNHYVFATADIFVTRNGRQEVLLGQKKNEVTSGLFRCIGGFVDKGDRRSKNTAVRELYEEATLSVKAEDLVYVETLEITEDMRYKYSTDSIMSTVFTVDVDNKANPVAGDDIAVVRWFTIDEVAALINPVHAELWNCFLTFLNDAK